MTDHIPIRQGGRGMVRKQSKLKNVTSHASRAERFLLGLAQRDVAAHRVEAKNKVKLKGERLSLTVAEADELVARDLAAWSSDEFVITDTGRAWAKRQMASHSPYRVQHGDVLAESPEQPAIELAESPLLWLHRRRDKTGNPLIGDAAFAAGERLRADFTFGNMTPRVTLNWTAAVQGSRNPHGAEPSESALAARQRVRRALEKVGPELSGILVDVCCFLKRLEDVERDRNWPACSAKIILSLGLARLARHYGYSDCAEGRELRRTG
jgi:hypothetical protein